jgi:hypothetical protein
MDAERARLLAIGERHEQFSQLGVAMLSYELIQLVAPAPPAPLAYDRERRLANVG